MVKEIFRNPIFVYGLCGISAVVVIQQFIVVAEFIHALGLETSTKTSIWEIVFRMVWGFASLRVIVALYSALRKEEAMPHMGDRVFALLNLLILFYGLIV